MFVLFANDEFYISHHQLIHKIHTAKFYFLNKELASNHVCKKKIDNTFVKFCNEAALELLTLKNTFDLSHRLLLLNKKRSADYIKYHKGEW